jgi:ABC-2 type transport system ATP-binding protein
VTKWFGGTTALDQVDLLVGPGVVHGLLGPNGAGKTTLLSALFGLVLPDEGTLRLFGRTRAEAGPGWLDGVGGFVETPRFYPYLTGRQNLAILAGLDGGDADGLIDQAIESAGLASARRQKVRGYSLGMRQRLGLAAAMLRRPRLLILDEPANGMDPAGIRDLRAALRRLARDGLTVLLSSHDMAQVEEICDSVTVLHHGKVVFAGGLSIMREDAPEPVWRLRTTDDAGAVEAARHLSGVKASAQDEGGLVVYAAQDRLDAYVLQLGRHGVALRGLQLEVTPLESLFFQLTGGAAPTGGAARPGLPPLPARLSGPSPAPLPANEGGS